MIRPGSLAKPVVEKLREEGVDVRAGDIKDEYEKLKTALADVSILVSTIVGGNFSDQNEMFRAAKEVGVQRVVPSDFGIPGDNGPACVIVRLPPLSISLVASDP